MSWISAHPTLVPSSLMSVNDTSLLLNIKGVRDSFDNFAEATSLSLATGKQAQYYSTLNQVSSLDSCANVGHTIVTSIDTVTSQASGSELAPLLRLQSRIAQHCLTLVARSAMVVKMVDFWRPSGGTLVRGILEKVPFLMIFCILLANVRHSACSLFRYIALCRALLKRTALHSRRRELRVLAQGNGLELPLSVL